MKIIIRKETSADLPAIREVNSKAFDREGEADLVENLRKSAQFISQLSLVAEYNNQVIGHILFSPVVIKNDQQEVKALALGPMAVLPEFQQKGIGSQLVTTGLDRCRESGYNSVIVLGHTEFYPRFGFKKADAFDIHPPEEAWEPAFFAVELAENALTGITGTVIYPPEFNEV